MITQKTNKETYGPQQDWLIELVSAVTIFPILKNMLVQFFNSEKKYFNQ